MRFDFVARKYKLSYKFNANVKDTISDKIEQRLKRPSSFDRQRCRSSSGLFFVAFIPETNSFSYFLFLISNWKGLRAFCE